MSEDPLAALEIYAANPNPETISRDAIIHWDDKTITVNDAYPKSWIHCLILPRPRPGLTMDDLRDLRTLLKGDKARAKQVLEELGEEAKRLVAQCEETMLKRCGCKWPIWVGFHALPSMRHLHLHVISSDFSGKGFKTKKHYNSFHPKLGFFLHYKDVMEWFGPDIAPSYFERKAALKISEYKHLLKEDLMCFHCNKEFKTMPEFIPHLVNVEFPDMKKEERARMERRRLWDEQQEARKERKRKREEAAASTSSAASGSGLATASAPTSESAAPPNKRQTTEEPEDGECEDGK